MSGRSITMQAVFGVAVVMASVWGSGVAIGSAATPAPAVGATCAAPPRSWTEISTLLANRDIATPAPTTGGQTLPEGTPVDEEMSAAMEEIVRHWLTCQNAGEPLRAWALFSDGYTHRLLSRQGGLSSDAYAALATPAPVADEPAELLEIRGQRVLPDGRYGATVTISYPSVPMPKTFFFFFTADDSRLMIDGILGEISFALP